MQEEFGGLGGGRSQRSEQRTQVGRTALVVKNLNLMNKRMTATTTAVSKLSKALNQVAEASKKTAKALRSLMSFDEINRLSKAAGSEKKTAQKKTSAKKSSSGGRKSSSSGGKKATSKTGTKNLKEAAQTVKKLELWKGLSAIKGFQQLAAAADQLAQRLKGALKWGYDHVLQPLKEWTLQKGLPAAFGMLTEALNVLCGVLDVLAPIGRAVWDFFLKPLASWAGDVIVAGLNALGDGFHFVYVALEGMANFLGSDGPLARLGQVMSNLFSGGIVEGLKKTASNIGGWFQNNVLKPLAALNPMVPIRVLLSKTRVEEAWNNLKEHWGNSRVVQTAVKLVKQGWSTVKGWIGSIPAVAEGVRLAKSGWTSVKSWIGHLNPVNLGVKLVKSGWRTVKEWIGSLSAKFDLKLPRVSVSWSGAPIPIPHFSVSWNAKGGILDGAQLFGMAGSTLLGGGEAGKEAVLPLERNTGWMDHLADRVVQRMDGGGQPIVVKVMLDGRVVGQSTVDYINRQRRITGQSPIRL